MDELDIERWEHALTQAEEQHKRVPIPYREIAYWRDLVPYKCIVRNVRLKTGLPICWGAVDCTENPKEKCTAGEHETCEKHVVTCFFCSTEPHFNCLMLPE